MHFTIDNNQFDYKNSHKISYGNASFSGFNDPQLNDAGQILRLFVFSFLMHVKWQIIPKIRKFIDKCSSVILFERCLSESLLLFSFSSKESPRITQFY